jgi:hypothetical protein
MDPVQETLYIFEPTTKRGTRDDSTMKPKPPS